MMPPAAGLLESMSMPSALVARAARWDESMAQPTTRRDQTPVTTQQYTFPSRRRKLIFCALWTEVCMAFTALDALREGYEVYPIVDAIGGTSLEAHRAGLERVVQADGQPISWVSLACELQRDQERVACLRPCAAATI